MTSRTKLGFALALGVTVACGLDGVSDVADVGNMNDGGAPADVLVAPDTSATDGSAPASPFGLDARPVNATCQAPTRPPSTTPVVLTPIYANVDLYFITAMEQPPNDPSRWLAVTLDGRVLSFPSVNPPAQPTQVADLGALAGMPVSQTGEGGLLDLAIHPKFAQNGQIFVSWTTTGGPPASNMRSVVSRLTSHDGGATFSEHAVILGPFDQPTTGHNGGALKFGPDGFLYLGFGDGGSSDDGDLYGQNPSTFFAKILRIDVDDAPVGKTYGIPASNPFASGGGEPATFASGFRNPFRFSFDRATGALWCADVGELQREEIDVVKNGGNYGWSCREGTLPFLPERCAPGATLEEPIFEYPHVGAARASIIGGVVYRGAAIPEIAGSYFYSDYSSGDAFLLSFDPTSGKASSTLLNPTTPRASFVSFAQDLAGEVYALDILGHVYQVTRSAPAAPSAFPDRLSKTGCFDAADPRQPASGLIPYDVNAPLWSDGASKERFVAIPDGKTIAIGSDGDFDLPAGSVVAKTFSLGAKRIETRLFVRHDDGDWAGYSYEWNDAQTDATLLASGKTKTIGAQTWSFPSRGECMSCHTSASGRTLGLEVGQLNRDLTYEATGRRANQLATLAHVGLFGAPLAAAPSALVAYPDPAAPGPSDARARAYLHANCSHCHRPASTAHGPLDLRFSTPLSAAHACNVAPNAGDLGVTGATILAPGVPSSSLLSLRPHTLGPGRMPPLASNAVDQAGLKVLDDFIRALPSCP